MTGAASPTLSAGSALPLADWRDLVALTKPRVMSLVVFTAFAAMIAAPAPVHPVLGFTAVLCVALGAGAAAALNMWWESDLDALMARTRNRPIPAGRMSREAALHFGVGLGAFSVLLMGLATNWLAAAILAASILFYVLVYTIWLKRRTPQNIVIGGAAGAFPPLIGWAAATGDIATLPILLFLIVFLWTPPHFWSLALFVRGDYAAAGVPMLPVVAGERTTRIHIMAYAVATVAASLAPVALGLAGPVYAVAAIALGVPFLVFPARVLGGQSNETMAREKRLFAYSILYLFGLFGALIADALLR